MKLIKLLLISIIIIIVLILLYIVYSNFYFEAVKNTKGVYTKVNANGEWKHLCINMVNSF